MTESIKDKFILKSDLINYLKQSDKYITIKDLIGYVNRSQKYKLSKRIKSIDVVVARYDEDIEWIKQITDKKIIIYNKGIKLNCDNEIMLDNVGREGHTYYTHIYNNYDNLADYTIFLQGNPFDHSPNILKQIQNISLESKIKFEFLSERILHCNLKGCIYHKNLPLKSVYLQLFGNLLETNINFTFGAGAQFVVSKKIILKRPKEFYLKIMKMLEYTQNPIEGFVIERFHKLIFSN